MKNLIKISGVVVSGAALAAGFFVFAAQTNELLPQADGALRQWIPNGGNAHFSLTNDAFCDGNSTYVYTNAVGARDSYALSLVSLPAGAVITKITIYPCASVNLTGGSSVLNAFYRTPYGNSGNNIGKLLTGTAVPSALSPWMFTNLRLSSSVPLEVGVQLTSGTAGARLSRLGVKLDYTVFPAPPSNLSITSVSPTINNLVWQDNSSNEAGFNVARSASKNFWPPATVSYLSTTTANATVFTDSSAVPDIRLYYGVRAFNSDGFYSGYSNFASSIYYTQVPTAPANLWLSLTATSSTSTVPSIIIRWTDTSANEEGFNVERGADSVNFSTIAVLGENATSYIDSSSTSSITYYRARAFNRIGTSTPSNIAGIAK